jgi:hypothetical protein
VTIEELIEANIVQELKIYLREITHFSVQNSFTNINFTSNMNNCLKLLPEEKEVLENCLTLISMLAESYPSLLMIHQMPSYLLYILQKSDVPKNIIATILDILSFFPSTHQLIFLSILCFLMLFNEIQGITYFLNFFNNIEEFYPSLLSQNILECLLLVTDRIRRNSTYRKFVIIIDKPKNNQNNTDNTTNLQSTTNRDNGRNNISGDSQDVHNDNINTNSNNNINNRTLLFSNERYDSRSTKCSSQTLRFLLLKSPSISSDHERNETPSVNSLISDANTHLSNNNIHLQSSKSLHSSKQRFKFKEFQHFLEPKKISRDTNETVGNELSSTSDVNEHSALNSQILSLLSKFLQGLFIVLILFSFK